jgi:transcriptional regulator with XRE-family HTH domain
MAVSQQSLSSLGRERVSPERGPIRIATLRHDPGISRERMARLMDVSAKTIQRWEERETLPQDQRVRRQFADLREIVDLGLVVYTEDGFREFLTTPLRAFDGLTALRMIELDRSDEVLAALATDYEGLGA